MKNVLPLLLLFMGFFAPAQTQTRKVLFLGNSYTEFNNLPQLVANAAASAGDVLIFDSHTPGGYKLIQHSNNAISQNKIMAGGWDYVVLQEQSQEPILNESNFYSGALQLNNLITQYNPCSVPLLYMTWGRKNGDELNCPNIPVMCTYETMDTALRNAYIGTATSLQTEISPVSAVWKYLRLNHPGIELYVADESHPSAAGSYAAACCFYASVFKKDPTLITFDYNLSPANAAIIRNAAKIIAYENAAQWDFKQMPAASFNYTIGSGTNEIVLANTMQNADSYLWDFGDGSTTSTSLNPTHSYANNGTYTITLTAFNCDLQGVHQSVHSRTVSFCQHTPTVMPETLMLCPQTTGTLWTQPADSYQWYENGVPIPGATNQYLTAIPNVTSFPSVMTTINGCSELSRQSYVGVHHWQFQILMFYVTVDGAVFDGNKVCLGQSVTLTAQVGEPHLAQWYKDDVPIPFANSDALIVTESGTYKVRIEHPMCPNMYAFSDEMMEFPLEYEFVDCSLGNVEFPETVLLFPNPANNILNFQAHDRIREVSVYDMLGKNIMTVPITGDSVDVSGLAQGIYTLKLLFENDTLVTSKFVKE